MISPWAVLAIATLYIGALFLIAHWGDAGGQRQRRLRAHPWTYSLALAVYCTSWTVYGSVGLASSSGFAFLPIYLGPILFFVFASPILVRVITISKALNITSIADFLAARFGKDARIAALVTVVAVMGVVPYVALQLKGVSSAILVFTAPSGAIEASTRLSAHQHRSTGIAEIGGQPGDDAVTSAQEMSLEGKGAQHMSPQDRGAQERAGPTGLASAGPAGAGGSEISALPDGNHRAASTGAPASPAVGTAGATPPAAGVGAVEATREPERPTEAQRAPPDPREVAVLNASNMFIDPALVAAAVIAMFAIAFGTRHADTTEHQNGLVLAIAAESVVKLVCLTFVGIFASLFMFDGFGALFAELASVSDAHARLLSWPAADYFIATTVLSFVCIILLPQQYHVSVVENQSPAEVAKARWLFPLYLIAVTAFVVPLAAAGLVLFPDGAIDRDATVLAVPLSGGSPLVAALGYIAGLSAATAMAIVACVATAIMISNNIVMPLVLSGGWATRLRYERVQLLLTVRRLSILALFALAYLFHVSVSAHSALASVGLLAFAAIAQLAPSFFGGLFWGRANARGALFAIVAGMLIWAYTLLTPWLANAGVINKTIVVDGLFGIAWLRPEALFGVAFSDPLAHAVFWSLLINTGVFVAASLSRKPRPLEVVQARSFGIMTDVSAMAPASRYLGHGGADAEGSAAAVTLAVRELRNAHRGDAGSGGGLGPVMAWRSTAPPGDRDAVAARTGEGGQSVRGRDIGDMGRAVGRMDQTRRRGGTLSFDAPGEHRQTLGQLGQNVRLMASSIAHRSAQAFAGVRQDMREASAHRPGRAYTGALLSRRDTTGGNALDGQGHSDPSGQRTRSVASGAPHGDAANEPSRTARRSGDVDRATPRGRGTAGSTASSLAALGPGPGDAASDSAAHDATVAPSVARGAGEMRLPMQTRIQVGDLVGTVAGYTGNDRSERAFREFANVRGVPYNPNAVADVHDIRFAEQLLASAVGTSSSHLALTLLLRSDAIDGVDARRLLDEASLALQFNRDLLHSALDQVEEGLAVFDDDLRLMCWNKRFRQLLGLSQQAVSVGVPLEDILRRLAASGVLGPGPVDDLVADRLHRLTVTRETFQEAIGDDDRIIEVRSRAMPRGGIVTTLTDISDRLRSAYALQAANEGLERRVRERTAELTKVNHALTEAKARADDANRDKTRFLAAASHDILQPLNAARLYTSSLVAKLGVTQEKDLVTNIDASLEAVEEILAALLDISRLDAGALEPELSEFALDPIFERIIVQFTPQAEERGLKLRYVRTGLWVRSDRRLLRRVIQNLVSNAVKYTTSGRVLMGCRRRGDGVSIQIWDTGPGIPRSKQSLIFKEFQRLEGSGGNARGLGLGLSIVQRIARVLGHTISVSSEPGRGSMFAVTVPTAQPKAAATDAPTNRPVTGTLAHRSLNLTVLCVDNEPAITDSMSMLLGNWGCTVLTARGRKEALAMIEAGAGPIDMILADYHLDDGTGVETVEGIRVTVEKMLPAIIITADQSAEVQREVRAIDAVVLRKPLKPASLRALMTRLSGGARQ